MFLLLFFSTNRCTSADVATAKASMEGVGLDWAVSFCTCTGTGTGTGTRTVLATANGQPAAPAIALAGAGEWALLSVGSVFGSTPSTSSERKASNENSLASIWSIVASMSWLYEVLGCKKSAINSPKTFEVDSKRLRFDQHFGCHALGLFLNDIEHNTIERTQSHKRTTG